MALNEICFDVLVSYTMFGSNKILFTLLFLPLL